MGATLSFCEHLACQPVHRPGAHASLVPSARSTHLRELQIIKIIIGINFLKSVCVRVPNFLDNSIKIFEIPR